MNALSRLLLLSLFALLLTRSLTAQPPDQTFTITSDGWQRNFLVHLPADQPDPNRPLLIVYHGAGMTSAQMRAMTGFNALANEFNFIVVYPQGSVIDGRNQWNVFVDGEPGHGGIPDPAATDDVVFTRDLIAYMKANYDIDESRVAATGVSNGGFMTYALSMLAHDAIMAIAPVAANMWADETYLTQLVTGGTLAPMPILHIHGTTDQIVPYPDPNDMPDDYGEYPLFVGAGIECGATTYTTPVPLMDSVDKRVFCGSPTEVALIRIGGMGHVWSNGTFPTSRTIVEFFRFDQASGVDAIDAIDFTVAPSIAAASFTVELPVAGRVQLVALDGSVVRDVTMAAGRGSIACDDLSSGVYLVRYRSGRGAVGMKRVMVVR